jgi:hypothetical protein
MSYETTTDAFVVVNGPEDGAEFPVTKGRVDFGRAPACTVSVRLDETIADLHARATVVSEGYLIRASGPSPVYVNGRRAGLVFSRIVRHGEVVQLGGTLLVCRCAPEGLACRSRGIRHANDLAWALRQLTDGAGWLANRFFKAVRHFIRFRMSGTMVPIALFLGVYVFYPPFRGWVHAMAGWLSAAARSLIGSAGL